MPRTGTCKEAELIIIGPGPSGGMADAADSKSAEGNLVRVRLSPRASFHRNDLATALASCPYGFDLRLSPYCPLGEHFDRTSKVALVRHAISPEHIRGPPSAKQHYDMLGHPCADEVTGSGAAEVVRGAVEQVGADES